MRHRASLLFLFLLSSPAFAGVGVRGTATASATPSPVAIGRCIQMVKAYNRCQTYMTYDPRENLVRFPSLRNEIGASPTAACDDGRNLPFEQRLQDSDVNSMLSQSYVAGKIALPETKVDHSPGGLRNVDFMKAVYGATREEVKANLVTVDFLGQNVSFNAVNGAAKNLALVSQDLLALARAKTSPELTAFLEPFINGPCSERCVLSNTTFAWRVVAGSSHLSNHSFGTAIDLQPASGTQYWLWDVEDLIRSGHAIFKPGADLVKKSPGDVLNFTPRTNPAYPEKLVEIFERHGFIWGGKWFRYDIMHFEYRPEFFPDSVLACE